LVYYCIINKQGNALDRNGIWKRNKCRKKDKDDIR